MRAPTSVLILMVALAIGGLEVSANADATVYVVHGVPDAVVDLALDGECVLEAVAFTDQAGPFSVPAGAHQITVSLADPIDPCGGEVVLDIPVMTEEGENLTAVAFLDEMCQPTAAGFDNDFSRTDPGKARLMLHHTACAPPIDIGIAREVDGMPEMVVQNFANGDQVVDQIRPGEWYVWLFEAGSGIPAIGPVLVQLKPFMTYRAYAVGSVLDGSADLVVFQDRTK